MATLTSKTFSTLVSDFAAAVTGSAKGLIDFTIGSVLRAVAEASSANTLWLQALAFQILKVTRLSTSTGADVDSFVGDFGIARLAAVPATGLVTFARFTPTLPAVIPVGAQVASLDGAQPFLVVANAANSAYSPTSAPGGLPGYTIGVNVTSMDLPVQAVNAGIQGNISAGGVTLLQTGISAIDTVVNAAAFTNGVNGESDASMRARFVLFINALAKATPGALGYAIVSLQQGLQYTITENADYNGALDYGMVTIIVDDGSGAVSGTLVTAAQNAVNAVRAAGVRVGVFAATLLTANVNMTIATAAGYDHPTLVGQVGTALTAYINALGLGNKLPYTRLEQIAYDVSPGIINVTNVLLNSASVDLVATYQQTIKSGTIAVS